MSHKSRPSLLGSLLWIGIGILLLLWNFGIVPDFWSLAGRYWPILLILLGAGKVLEYFLRKDAVSIRVGDIIGILFLALIGTAINGVSKSHVVRLVQDLPIQLGGTSVKPGQWLGESHSYTEEATYPLGRAMPIRIENSYGSVSISPGSDREIQVRLKKTVYAQELNARGIAGEIHLMKASERKGESTANPKPEAEPGKQSDAEYFVVRTNREDLTSKNYNYNTDMEILVPKNSQLQVANAFGEVRVNGINGNLDLSAAHRLLDVRDCTGQFTIATRYADARLTNLVGNVNLDGRGRIYLDNIKGDVRVTNEYSPTEILNVDGKVTVSSTEGNIRIDGVSQPVVLDARGSQVRVGNLKNSLKVTANHQNVDIYDVASTVTVESRYCTLSLKGIKGNVEMNSNSDRVSVDEIEGSLKLKARASSIRLNGIKGPLDVQNSLKEIIVNNLGEGCNISNEYADISVSAQRLDKGDIQIKSRNGAIDLFLPETASFSLDATARNGKIRSDYAGLESVRNESNTEMLRSQVKTGGPRITLDTQYGNIHVARTSVRKVEMSFKKKRSKVYKDLNPAFDWDSIRFFNGVAETK